MFKSKFIFYFIISLLTMLTLTACDTSDSGSDDSLQLSGIVVDDPLANASITVSDMGNGQIIATGQTNSKGEYDIEIPDTVQYRIRSEDGFLNGTTFNGTLENFCDPSQKCNITPLTTVTVRLVDRHGFRLEKARKEASQLLGFQNNETDPFVLAVQGEKNENGTIEGLDSVNLDYIRGRINSANSTFTDWLNETIERVEPPYNTALTGTAELVSPLEAAEVLIIDEDGYVFSTTTDCNGGWESPCNMKLTGPFRVETLKGLSDSNEFNGTLSAYIPFREFGYDDTENQTLLENIHVTILSTLIDRYMQHSEKNFEHACARVKKFLSIPQDVDLNDKVLLEQYFSPSAFRTVCSKNNNFNNFIDTMILDVDSGGTVSIIDMDGTSYSSPVTWGGRIFESLMDGALSSAVGFGLQTTSSYLLPALGFETPEQKLQQELEDIREHLENMDIKLDSLSNDVRNLMTKLSETLSSVWIGTAQTGFTAANNDAVFIEDAYDDLISLKKFSEREKNNNEQKRFQEFCDITLSEISSSLSKIYAHMYEPPSGTGAMDALTKALEERIRNAEPGNKGAILLDSYQDLEKNFTRMMGIQMEGILLFLNKYNWEEGKTRIESDTIEETSAWDYLTSKNKNPYTKIIKQTDAFMTYVDRLVVASANTKTVLGNGSYNMFPSTVDEVFYSADLLVQTFSPKHRASFVYRVIGDPNPTQFSPQKGTYTEINGETVRNYPPPFPTDYPEYYLSWSQVSEDPLNPQSAYHVERQTKIISSKRTKFENIEKEVSTREDGDFPFTNSYLSAWDTTGTTVTFDRINPFTGEKYNEQDKENGVVAKRYGHSTVIARIMPKFYTGYLFGPVRKGKITSSKGKYDCADLTTEIVLSSGPGPTWGEMTRFIQMHTTLENDTNEDIPIKITGEIQGKIHSDTERSFANTEKLNWDISLAEDSIISEEHEQNGGKIQKYEHSYNNTESMTLKASGNETLSFKTCYHLYYSGLFLKQFSVDFRTQIINIELK